MVARAYCFTYNNYTEEDILNLSNTNIPIRYICWGQEIAPETGTPHLQGYIEFTKPMRITGIKKINPTFSKMHLECRKGTREEAKAYCAKGIQSKEEWNLLGSKGPNFGIEAIFIEFGNWEAGGSGTRNDLDAVRETALNEGMRGVTLKGNNQQIKVAEKFLTYHEEPRDWETTVHWYFGESGSGKSRSAREALEGVDFFTKNDGTKWWDGYDGHEAVIIDDFRDSWWSLTEMLSLLDRYEKRVETKGGWRQFKPKQIIVTSIHPPEYMYKIADEDSRQLIRRVHLTKKFVTRFCNEVEGVILEPLDSNEKKLINKKINEIYPEDNIASDEDIVLDI